VVLQRETAKLEAIKYRIHLISRDEKLDDYIAASGQTLLEKIREQDKTAALSKEQK